MTTTQTPGDGREKHPADGKVEPEWLEYIPALAVGDRLKFSASYKTIFEVLQIVPKGCVLAVAESPMAVKGSHKYLAEWKQLAHTIKL